MPIIHVVVKFRNEYPEVSARNKAFAMLKSGGLRLVEGNPEADICNSLPFLHPDLNGEAESV